MGLCARLGERTASGATAVKLHVGHEEGLLDATPPCNLLRSRRPPKGVMQACATALRSLTSGFFSRGIS